MPMHRGRAEACARSVSWKTALRWARPASRGYPPCEGRFTWSCGDRQPYLSFQRFYLITKKGVRGYPLPLARSCSLRHSSSTLITENHIKRSDLRAFQCATITECTGRDKPYAFGRAFRGTHGGMPPIYSKPDPGGIADLSPRRIFMWLTCCIGARAGSCGERLGRR